MEEPKHGNKAFPANRRLIIATWNVEGLTESKLVQLVATMERRNIDILCIQETREVGSAYRYVYNGFMYINSGASEGDRSFAGVGFLLSPSMQQSVISFRQISDRVCTLKLKTLGGKLMLINTYAPHGGYDFDVRQEYYNMLSDVVAGTQTHGLQVVLGDFNARIHRRFNGEEDVLGEYCFGSSTFQPDSRSSRELLVQM